MKYILTVFLLSFSLFSGSIKTISFKEGFKIKVSKKIWNTKSYSDSKFGLSFMATAKKKNPVKYFSVTIKKMQSKKKISTLCSENVKFLKKSSKEKVSSKLINHNKRKVCYLNYRVKATEQYLFITRKNFLVSITVENASRKKKSAKNIIKLFSI